jgi:hypothetical protein
MLLLISMKIITLACIFLSSFVAAVGHQEPSELVTLVLPLLNIFMHLYMLHAVNEFLPCVAHKHL